MPRRAEGCLFIGRLDKRTRTRDLEEIFEVYGRMLRCEIKYGAEMAYAFVDYEDRLDAEDAMKYENGREVSGSRIVVEYAQGAPRRPLAYDPHLDKDRRREKSPKRYRSPKPRRSRSRSGSRSRRRRSRSRSRSRSRDRYRSSSRSRSRNHSDRNASRVSKSRSRSLS